MSARVYVDSSALLKRVFAETESAALVSSLRQYVADGSALLASSVGWIEVSRAIRSLAAMSPGVDVDELIDVTLSGVSEIPMSPEVVAVAKRISPPVLRTLDAIHLATAVLTDVDVIITYDERFSAAASSLSIGVRSPTG